MSAADLRNDPEPGAWAAAQEAALLEAALPLAPVHGWTDRLAAEAGRAIGLDRPTVELLLPQGARDLAALMVRRHDAGMLAALAEVDPQSLKIRERIGRAVKARLDVAARDEAAVRRWAGYLALPPNLPLALALGWSSADLVWRWAGDTATDENHYSKRTLLGAILISALAARLGRGRSEAESYVDARIADVMSFEKWKAGLRPFDLGREVVQALARLRYGAFT